MHFIRSDVNHMCSRFREIDLFVVKIKHGMAAVQKLGFVHDHLAKKGTVCWTRIVSGNFNAE